MDFKEFKNYFKIYNNCFITNSIFKESNNDEYKLNPWIILDINCKYIEKQSPYENISLVNKYLEKNKIIVENKNFIKTFLFFSNTWDFNVQCVFLELFPKIILCKNIINENNNYDIFINYKFKDLWLELFEIFEFKFNNINFIFHKTFDEEPLIIKDYYYKEIYNFGIDNMHRTCYKHKIFKLFLEKLTNKLSKNYVKYDYYNIAILRDNNNKNNTQLNRRIININEVKKKLIENNFEIINTETMSIQERYNKLKSSKKILIEAGASIVNLLLVTDNNKKIIILCNENMYNYHGIYEDIIKYYFDDVNIIIGKMKNELEKSNEFVNYPFIIDTKLLEL